MSQEKLPPDAIGSCADHGRARVGQDTDRRRVADPATERVEHLRQALAGELIDDVEGALWTRAMLEPHRVASVHTEQLARIVVAVDPAVRSGAGKRGPVVGQFWPS